MHILIVDDEELIRGVIKEYAEGSGFTTDEAENGLDAIEKCKKNDYDLIIMDIMMPKLDGLSAIKEIFKTKKVPVLMLSARGEEYDKLLGFELGIDDYVTKPFSPRELIARVKAILKRSNQSTDIITIDKLKIDKLAREVTINNKTIKIFLHNIFLATSHNFLY